MAINSNSGELLTGGTAINSLYPCRRAFLQSAMGGFGSLAFMGLTNSAGAGEANTVPRSHFPARAKSVIYLYMEGGPSQVDTFDEKPVLKKLAGQALPFKKPATVFNSSNKLMPSPYTFRRHGESGSNVSSLFPHIAKHVDDLTFLHSMHHDISNHSAACYMSHTGDAVAGRPCMGSWLTYGLGSENADLPGFVVLDCGQAPSGGAPAWSSGFLPASHAGVKFLKGSVPVEFINRQEATEDDQAAKLLRILQLGKNRLEQSPHDQKLEAVIRSYEKAARMQMAVPELMDVSRETKSTLQLYGMDDPKTQVFGSRCLLARRLVERGVRFIELFSPRVKADRWDQHGGLKQGHINNAIAVDKPIAGLIEDLKSRGLLESTIVLWGGEFGRTPTTQGGSGRDHNPFGYTVFLAGGGFQGGLHYGSTDEFGYFAQQDKVHLHDLHATILHQMGIDHKKLTFRYNGRDFRLTDVHGRVVPITS